MWSPWLVAISLLATCGACSESAHPVRGVTVEPARGVTAAGWHTESWQDVEVEVPDSWRGGSRAAWCANGGSAERSLVERPDQPRRDILCRKPTESLGLTFRSGAAFDPAVPSGSVWRYDGGAVDVYLPGSWLGLWYDGKRVVQVNADDRATVEHVLASVRLDGGDMACPPGVYANTDFALDGDNGGRLRVCRFVAARDPAAPGDDELADATELTAEGSVRVRAALAQAPVIKKSEFRRCTDDRDGDDREFYLVSTPDQVAFWLYNSVCGDHGVLTIGDHGKLVYRAVTADLLDALGSPIGPLRG